MKLTIDYTRLFKNSGYFIVFLVIVSAIFKLCLHFFPGATIIKLNTFFYLGTEKNLPSLFSALQLWFAAAILFILSAVKFSAKDKYRFHWAILGIVFLFLGYDEWKSMHEKLNNYLHDHFHFHGVFFLAWVIPACLFLVFLGIFFLRFLFALPVKTRRRIIIAAGIFLGGAVGLEMLESIFVEKNGGDIGIPVVAMIHLEEFMEMFGITYFIYALFEFMFEVGARETKFELIIKSSDNVVVPDHKADLIIRSVKHLTFYGKAVDKK
ncbi:MAG: putative rane protein [Chitinophagaceae bacterium]|nr:putative rane protein [Chitinophagaceae bacterium]